MSHQLLRRGRSGAVLSLVLAAALMSRQAHGQAVIDAKSAATLRDQYMADLDTVHVKIMALANAIPEDKYSWRPAPGVRSIAEALMHVASRMVRLRSVNRRSGLVPIAITRTSTARPKSTTPLL